MTVPIEVLIEKYEETKSTYRVAEAVGVCQRTVWASLHKAGYQMLPRGGPRIQATIEVIIEKYEELRSVFKVAKALGVSSSGIYCRLKKAGYKMQRRGRPEKMVTEDCVQDGTTPGSKD